MVNAIRQQFDAYVQHLPAKIPEMAFKSAIYSFAISALLTANVETGLIVGSLAATVSVVSGLTMPLFRKTFGDYRGNMSWYHDAASRVVNLGITQCLVNTLTAYRVNLLISAVYIIAWNVIFREFNDRPTDNSQTYVLIP